MSPFPNKEMMRNEWDIRHPKMKMMQIERDGGSIH